MFSAALFVLIDCQFARCPHLSRGRALRERASADKSPSRDVKKRLAALFAIEFSIGPYPVLPRCPPQSPGKSANEDNEIFHGLGISRYSHPRCENCYIYCRLIDRWKKINAIRISQVDL